MALSGRFRRFAREWTAAVLGVAALGVAATVGYREWNRAPYHLRISAGSREGLRHRIATRLASAASRKGLDLKLVNNSGSEESLERVEAGALDVALVQGGSTLRRGRMCVRSPPCGSSRSTSW